MIFGSKSSIPEHQPLSVFISKNPVFDPYFFNHFFGGFGRKNQLFTVFNVDHFSRLLRTQNNPKIFFWRFAPRALGDSRALSRGFWPAGRARKTFFFRQTNEKLLELFFNSVFLNVAGGSGFGKPSTVSGAGERHHQA